MMQETGLKTRTLANTINVGCKFIHRTRTLNKGMV